MTFILASASPRRVELLGQIGLQLGRDFEQRPADIDESRIPGEDPDAYVLRMARSKARFVSELMQSEVSGQVPDFPFVLGADTTVVLADRIFGKPESRAEAIETLLALSGRRHQVLSAVAICGISGMGVLTERSLLSETWVRFKTLTQTQCQDYWSTGESRGKAGAYAIQGRAAVFVAAVEGSYSGVVGLPLAETNELLENYGVSGWDRP